MVEWLKNFVANFDLGDLFAILGTLFSSGIGLWALRIYKSYKLLKDKSVDEIVRGAMGEQNEKFYNKTEDELKNVHTIVEDMIREEYRNLPLRTK